MSDPDDLAAMAAENARLIALLESRGIDWRLPSQTSKPDPEPVAVPVPLPAPVRSSTEDKVALFRRLFRGRADVFSVRWEKRSFVEFR